MDLLEKLLKAQNAQETGEDSKFQKDSSYI